MSDLPDTRESLVVRLADPQDHAAWAEFAELYRPAVYRLARRKGLQPADAEDVTQQVFVSVAQAVRRWEPDPHRGRFRSWLLRIAKNAALNALTRTRPDASVGGSSMLELLHSRPDSDAGLEAELAIEYRRQVFRWAVRQVREEVEAVSWEAFWITTVGGESVEMAAQRLGKTPGAIYVARCRIMRRLRDRVQEYGGEEE